MAASTYELRRSPARVEVQQLGVGTVVLMFAWPAVWYTLLIYVFGRAFIPDGGTTPTWFRLLVMVFGGGAELVAGLVLLQREGYRLSIEALRNRLRIRWPQGWKAWVLAGMVLLLGEEISYRGYLLPRMRGAFGRWDWIANGVLFTLKHVYQRWLYPGVLVGSLCFAFAAGPLGSLPLAMVYHWVGNFLFQMVSLVLAATGVG